MVADSTLRKGKRKGRGKGMDKREVEERERSKGKGLTILNSGRIVKGLTEGAKVNRGEGVTLLTFGCEGKR